MASPVDVVVIGSGVAGLSTALQLARRGLRVRVLERATLASGSTSRASGLFGQMRGTVAATRLLMESRALLTALRGEYGDDVYRQSGSIRIAQTPARAAELETDVAVAREAGLTVELLTQAELRRRAPEFIADDVLLASFAAADGYLDPPELAKLYIALGREAGIEFIEHCRVDRIGVTHGAVHGVHAGDTFHEAPVVVNAAGPWSFLVADLVDQPLPSAGIAHYYLTTEPGALPPMKADMPTLRDRENRIYSRPCHGCLRVGMYEAAPNGIDVATLPHDYSMATMTADRSLPVIAALCEAVARRFRHFTADTAFNVRGGIMAFTPDGHALLGELPGLAGFYHCAGFCGHGVTQSPIIGKLLAEWIADGRGRDSLAALAADRFWEMPALRSRKEVARQCEAAYGAYYALPAAAKEAP